MYKFYFLFGLITSGYYYLFNNPMNDALIIVDMQNDFVTGTMAVPNANLTYNVINKLLNNKFNIVIWTQDWHPTNHISFWENRFSSPFFKDIKSKNIKMYESIHLGNGYEHTYWPKHTVQNTWGADIVTDLNRNKYSITVRKGSNTNLDSYSAFNDNFHVKSTYLKEFLKFAFVKNIYIVGLAYDYCVGYTAIDAANYGFNTTIIMDGTKSVSKSSSELMTTKLKEMGVNLINYEELL